MKPDDKAVATAHAKILSKILPTNYAIKIEQASFAVLNALTISLCKRRTLVSIIIDVVAIITRCSVRNVICHWMKNFWENDALRCCRSEYRVIDIFSAFLSDYLISCTQHLAPENVEEEWLPQTKRNRLLLEDDPAEIGCLGNWPRDLPTTDVLSGNCRVIILCFFTVTDTFALLYVKQTFPVLHENEIAFGQRSEYP